MLKVYLFILKLKISIFNPPIYKNVKNIYSKDVGQ